MFNTEQEFLDAFLAFPGWETDPSVVQTIMTIVVDGVPFIVTGSMDTVPDMAALIASINNSEAGEFVMASVAQDARTHDFYLAINARVPSVASITVLNDQTLLFNRVSPPPNDGSINGDFITGTAAVEVFGSNPVVNDQIEPKNDGSVLERVFIPIHTTINSDAPEVNINYWAAVKYPTQNEFRTHVMCSVVSATHPSTNEAIIYSLYNSETSVTIEARYADGNKSGQLVTGLINNKISFRPLPNYLYDDYSDEPKILSGTLAYDNTTGRLFMKTVVIGVLSYDGSAMANTSLLVVSELDPMLSLSTNWIRTLSHNEITEQAMMGFGVYQRSDGGLAVDPNGNLIVAANILIPGEDTGSGTPYAPGFELVKYNANGGMEWRQIVSTGYYYDPTADDDYSIPGGEFTTTFGKYFPIPATVAITPTGDICAGHGTCIHKFSSDGSPMWTKEFENISLSVDPYSGTAIGYVSDIACHDNMVYAAITGVSWSISDSYDGYAYVIAKFADVANVDYHSPTDSLWLSGCYTSTDNYWQYDSINLWAGVSMSMNDGVLTVAYSSSGHYNNGGEGDTGAMTIAQINTTSPMSIVWANDVSIMSVDGSSSGTMLVAPIPYGQGQTGIGYTNLVSTPLGVSYGGSIQLDWADEFTYTGGLVVCQQNNATVAQASTSPSVAYRFVDSTTPLVDFNSSVRSQNTTFEVYGGEPLVSDEAYIDTWTGTFTGVTLPSMTNNHGDYVWNLPPMQVTITTSLDVVNIASVGELQLGGLFPTPTSAVGSLTDKAGALRADSSGIYYCTADYNGTTEVWKSIRFGSAIRSTPPGLNDATLELTGSSLDKVGELYLTDNNILLVCTGVYNGSDAIWEVVGLPTTGGNGITIDVQFTYDYGTSPYWPQGAYVRNVNIELSSSGGGGGAADVVGGCVGKPDADVEILRFVVPRTMRITSDGASYLWRCRTAPSSTVNLPIHVDGYFVGQMRFWGGDTTGNIHQSWNTVVHPGSVITVKSPSIQDATFGDVFFTITGNLE